jgi:hypothetical protein
MLSTQKIGVQIFDTLIKRTDESNRTAVVTKILSCLMSDVTRLRSNARLCDDVRPSFAFIETIQFFSEGHFSDRRYYQEKRARAYVPGGRFSVFFVRN